MEVKPGYKQTEVGVIPEDWVSLTFKDGVAFYIDYRGRTPRKLGMSWGGGDILALSANNVQMGRIDPEKEPTFGSDSLYQKWMCQGHCECGDILLTMEAPLGNVARVPDSRKYILSQRVILVRPHSWIDRAFLSYFMMETYFQNQLQNNSSGTTAKGIQRQKLDLIQVYLPHSKDEQIAIATVLSDMDSEIESLETKLSKTRQIKQGMMQELLTGRIRLV
jgi:type I restriction enzyme S subunit